MSNLAKYIGIGAACSACLAAPAIIAAIGGAGLTGAGIGIGSGWMSMETALCLIVPALMVLGGYLYLRQVKKTEAACTTDGACGCGVQYGRESPEERRSGT